MSQFNISVLYRPLKAQRKDFIKELMKIRYLLVPLFLLGATSCTCPGSGSETERAVVEDNSENRYVEAAELVKLYPVTEWGNDILQRIKEKTGADVAEQFKQRILEKSGEKQLLETRLKIITEILSAPEIAALHSLLETPAGKSAFKKLYLIDEQLTRAIGDDLAKVLSGRP